MPKITIEFSVSNNQDDVIYHITQLLQSCLPYMVDNLSVIIDDLQDEEDQSEDLPITQG